MIILAIRTDKPEAEITLYEDARKLASTVWEAHRQLADTIHLKIEALLQSQQKSWQDIKGIVVFKGPGSFTGLRIGISVANALAYGLSVPIVSETDENWRDNGITRLVAGENEKISVPEYGGEANITAPKK